jgi:hypothetical protein
MGNGNLSVIVSVSSGIIIALISALWFNLNSEIAELKITNRGLEVAVGDLKMNLQEVKNRYDKLVEIFNDRQEKKPLKK